MTENIVVGYHAIGTTGDIAHHKFIIYYRADGTAMQIHGEGSQNYGWSPIDELSPMRRPPSRGSRTGQAREVAREHLRSMRMGIDPRDLKRQDEAMKITLRQVADAYFARPGMLKESTRAEMDRHIEKVFEAWKERPIASITPAECRKRFEEMATHGLRGKGPAPTQASLALVTLRTLINFTIGEYKQADGKPLIEHNAVDILKKELKPSVPRTRQIDRRKVGEFWHLLAEARHRALDDDALAGVDLVRFLLLTGARRNEGAELTWDRVNIDDDDPTNCWWHLPDPKNRNPVWLPLSSQAVAVLKSRKRVSGNPHVFPSRSRTGHIMDTRGPLERLSKRIGMERLSAHDMRRTFVTLGVKACRLDVAKLELLTNHVPQGVTARHYLETSDLRDYHPEVQAIGDLIEAEAAVAAGRIAPRTAALFGPATTAAAPC
ncbi:tyrosine-type recombinase/integrase [Rhodomicrobium sp. Az07]|uniref:tyrosine-type recombinase/integrase n=1 Tax=Rhodomicrobium sp. Az07 TaxID=2839034 RepID=UPI001BE628F7|nr:tyrosine-type recombinase/integrase [Rhodomicrobium sp. Az07]MBT3071898.1 tyrosine-type recombinase/integrase [Rhodomicrobium sp. Az07]